MKTPLVLAVLLCLSADGCSRKQQSSSASPATFGAAMVESSGGKQVAAAGMLLPQPVMVQVNDDQGNGVTGAAVEFSGPRGVVFDPASGVTDSSGQFTTNVALGGGAGRYEITASTLNKSHKQIELKLQEIALDYFYNKMSDDDVTALITHGGPALNKSPAMPPYGFTLSKSDIQALLAFIRAVSDPPYQGRGLVYAEK